MQLVVVEPRTTRRSPRARPLKLTSRRKWLLGAASAVALDAFVIEPRWLRIETKRIAIFGGKFSKPVRLVQLSDLHYSWCVTPEMIESAFKHALNQKPDLICITGDFISRASQVNLDVLTDLTRPLASRVPTYAVKGNHDGGAWARLSLGEPNEHGAEQAVTRGGVKFLHNQSEQIRLHQGEFWLAGVGDLWSDDVRPDLSFRNIGPEDRVVLMAHNPDTKTNVSRENWQLMLSGHTHGAQNSLPGLRDRFAPVRDKRFIAGLCRWEEGERWIHVNRGVGNLHAVRFLCPPEVSVLELV